MLIGTRAKVIWTGNRLLVTAIALALLCAIGVRAQDDAAAVAETVKQLRTQYPTPMSDVQLGDLLNRVAWQHRQAGWGLLRKDSGTRCPAPQGVRISCDILIHAPSVRHFDVLAAIETEATPTWRDAGPCVLGPSSGCEMARFVAPVDSGTAPPPPPVTPEPPDASELEALRRDVAQTRQFVATLAETAREHHDRLNALMQHARQTDEWRARIEQDLAELKARPVVRSCRAALNVGVSRIPISCTLQP